jgi:hypothetical protein
MKSVVTEDMLGDWRDIFDPYSEWYYDGPEWLENGRGEVFLGKTGGFYSSSKPHPMLEALRAATEAKGSKLTDEERRAVQGPRPKLICRCPRMKADHYLADACKEKREINSYATSK